MAIALRPVLAVILCIAGTLLLAGALTVPVSVLLVAVLMLGVGLAILLEVLPLADGLGATLTSGGLLVLISPTVAAWIGDWSPIAVQAGGGVLLLTAAVIAWGGEPAKR